MEFTIKDGTGNAYEAKVTPKNRLKVLATTQTEEHSASLEDELAFFLNITATADTLTTATGNTYNVLFLQNDSPTGNVVIEKVLASADASGGVMGWIRNPDVGTVGANNDATPVNLNFSSGKDADATCYVWDESGTTGITGITDGTKVKTFIIGAGFTAFPIDGALILGQGDKFLIYFTNTTGGAVEFECGIRFYVDDDI